MTLNTYDDLMQHIIARYRSKFTITKKFVPYLRISFFHGVSIN